MSDQSQPKNPAAKAPRDPVALLNAFLEREGMVLVPGRALVTFTEDGGAIIRPNFTVAFRQ